MAFFSLFSLQNVFLTAFQALFIYSFNYKFHLLLHHLLWFQSAHHTAVKCTIQIDFNGMIRRYMRSRVWDIHWEYESLMMRLSKIDHWREDEWLILGFASIFILNFQFQDEVAFPTMFTDACNNLTIG